MSKVRLEDCDHNTRDNCGASEGAGAVCRNPSRTTTTTTTATTTQQEKGKSNRGLKKGEEAFLVSIGVLGVLLGVLLVCSVMGNQKKRRSSEENGKHTRGTTELSTSQGNGVSNDSFVPEVPSAPPLYPPLSQCEADEEPPMLQLIKQLLNSTIEKITKEKADLECPVCLETADVPIYTCPKQHLICSVCRPKVIY